jgi:hypothetical protein
MALQSIVDFNHDLPEQWGDGGAMKLMNLFLHWVDNNKRSAASIVIWVMKTEKVLFSFAYIS